MGYTLPLEQIPLEDYRQLLRQQNLLPGRRILWEKLDARFALLADAGFSTLAQLAAALSTPSKLITLAAKTGISEEYLTILRRELGSLAQKPVPLAEFPGCDPALIASLAASGIRSSQALWEHGNETSAELFALCDLVRINGVGAVAARVFYEAGFDTVGAVACAGAADILARVSAVNAEKGYYKAKLGEKDMQFCIDYAKLLVRYS
ncbi:MAG: DUF4332 domain-containing protein [Clostridiaceae bacterium]